MTTIKAIQHLSQLPLVGPNFLLSHSLSSMAYPQGFFHPDPRQRMTRQSLPVSNAYWPDLRPPTRPDASQHLNPFLNVAFGHAQQTAVWPTGYQASNTFPFDGSAATFSFFAAGSGYYPHGIACPSSGCILPMHDPAPSTSGHPFQPPSQSFHGIRAGSAAVDMNFVPTTKNLATNEANLQRPYNPLHDQTFGITATGCRDLPAQATFQYAFSSMQHEATPVHNGDLGRFRLSTEGYSFFEQLVQQLKNDNILTSITGGAGRAAQFTFQCPPPTQNAATPIQDAHPNEVRLGTREHFALQQAPQQPNRGAAICPEVLRLYIAENPEALTDRQIGSLVIAATVLPSDPGQSAFGSQDDANYNAVPSLHGTTSQGMVSPSSNAVTLSSASSLPGGSCFSPQNIFEATAVSSPKRAPGSSTAKKRQRTEDQERPGKQKRKRSMVSFPSLASHTC